MTQPDGRPPSDWGARPRLLDAFGLDFKQEDVDFAIPHIREDLPFCLDPFLLWKSDKDEYIHLTDR